MFSTFFNKLDNELPSRFVFLAAGGAVDSGEGRLVALFALYTVSWKTIIGVSMINIRNLRKVWYYNDSHFSLL